MGAPSYPRYQWRAKTTLGRPPEGLPVPILGEVSQDVDHDRLSGGQDQRGHADLDRAAVGPA